MRGWVNPENNDNFYLRIKLLFPIEGDYYEVEEYYFNSIQVFNSNKQVVLKNRSRVSEKGTTLTLTYNIYKTLPPGFYFELTLPANNEGFSD